MRRFTSLFFVGLALLLVTGCGDDESEPTSDTSPDTDTTRTASCGNDMLEAGEMCDLQQLNSQTCVTQGFEAGTLTCNATCTGFDTSACTGGSPCVMDCSGRVCGPDPVCIESCGTCSEGTCDAAGQCVASDPGGPTILTFNSNVSALTQGESITFSVVVTDPDGVDDVIGGTLEDPTTGASYGAFATSAAEGSYSLALDWAAIDQVQRIEFETEAVRTFVARFFDQAGHTTNASREITLTCGGMPACNGVCGWLACSGSCVAPRTDEANCGACGNVCASGAQCNSGGCACPGSGLVDCPGTGCTNLDSDLANCGTCGSACLPGQWCNAGTCQCGSGTTECPGLGCFDMNFDVEHCGGCDVACTTGESCFVTGNCGCRNTGACPGTQRCLDASACYEVGQTLISGVQNDPQGMPQLELDGEQVYVCYSATAAEVICRELFGTGVADIVSNTAWTNIWYVGATCDGTEASLADCDLKPHDNCGALMYITCSPS